MTHAIQVLKRELDRLWEEKTKTNGKALEDGLSLKIEDIKRAIAMISE